MKKVVISVILMVSQSVLAGWFSSDLKSPCRRIYFDDYERALSEHRRLLAEYRQLTGQEFDQKNKNENSAGSLTAALLCPISAGFAIASGGVGIAGPLLFCGQALALGSAADSMSNGSQKQPTTDVSVEKQKRMEEMSLKINQSKDVLRANSSREILLFHESYTGGFTAVFNAILENSEKITGEKLERGLLNKALATMRASKNDEFCPNNKPMNFSELTAELLKRYNALGAN